MQDTIQLSSQAKTTAALMYLLCGPSQTCPPMSLFCPDRKSSYHFMTQCPIPASPTVGTLGVGVLDHLVWSMRERTEQSGDASSLQADTSSKGRGSASHVRVSSFPLPTPNAAATSSTTQPPTPPPLHPPVRQVSHLHSTWMFNFTLLAKEQTATHHGFLGKLVRRHFQINSTTRNVLGNYILICVYTGDSQMRVTSSLFLFVTFTSCFFFVLCPAVIPYCRKKGFREYNAHVSYLSFE